MSSHRNMDQPASVPVDLVGPPAGQSRRRGREARRIAAGDQAQEPARDRPDARGGTGRRQGARPGAHRWRCPGVTTADMDEAVAADLSRASGDTAVPGLSQLGQGQAPVPGRHLLQRQRTGRARNPEPPPAPRGRYLSVDTGCKVNGWCGDAAVTLAIGAVRPEVQKLLDVTSETLNLAIRAMGRCRPGWRSPA